MEKGDKGLERDKGGWVEGGVVEEDRWRGIDEPLKRKFAAEGRIRIRGKGQGGGESEVSERGSKGRRRGYPTLPRRWIDDGIDAAGEGHVGRVMLRREGCGCVCGGWVVHVVVSAGDDDQTGEAGRPKERMRHEWREVAKSRRESTSARESTYVWRGNNAVWSCYVEVCRSWWGRKSL